MPVHYEDSDLPGEPLASGLQPVAGDEVRLSPQASLG